MNPHPRQKILIVDDHASVIDSMSTVLSARGFQIVCAHNFAQALVSLRNAEFDLVITDLCLPDATGMDVINEVKTETPDTEVILMTGHGSVDVTIEAIKRGAYYYLEKPCALDRLNALVDRALETSALRRENQTLKRNLTGDSETFGMIGRHPKLHHIIQTIRTAAPSDASLLIEG